MSDGWTIPTLIHELAGRGEKPCLIAVSGEKLRTISCASLASRVISLAWGMRESGIRPGDTIGIIAPNGPDWVIARLALGCVGALVHALDDLFSAPELKIALEEAKCSRIFTSPSHVAQIREIDPGLQLVVLDDTPLAGIPSWRSLFLPKSDPLPPFDSAAPAMLVNTSGTTGRPKGFLLTSDHLWANVGALAKTGTLRPDDRVLLPLPLHHVYPFTIGILTVLTCGCTVVFPEEVAGPPIMRAIALGGVSVVVGVPRLYTALVSGLQGKIAAGGALSKAVLNGLIDLSIRLKRRFDLNAGWVLLAPVRKKLGPRLRMVVSGGALLQPDVLWPLVGLGLEVRTGYGLAETASIFTGNLPGGERLESQGKSFCGEMRIVAQEGGSEGEIQLRGPSVFAGYRNNDEANREAFTPDGWFRTGDVGYIDADGFLFVTGRIKETLVLGGGKKLHPDELEKHYGASRFFKELAILERDGALVALVLPDVEAIRAAGSPRIDEVIRVALSETALTLPSYERLAGYRIVREPLPKTRLGKFQRFRLPAIYEAAESGAAPKPQGPLSPEDKALLDSEPARTIFGVLKTRYAGKPVSLDASPQLDLGIDSLEWVALALVLEQQAGVHLDETVAGESLTVRDLLVHAGKAAASSSVASRAQYEAVVQRWLQPAGPALRALAGLLIRINAGLMPRLFSLTVRGAENIPANGPYVVAINHESDLDPMVVAAALGRARMRHVYWGADSVRVFGMRWAHGLMRALNMFPADERRPGETLAIAVEVLRRGECLIWFPESWRSPDGKLQRFLPGIGHMLAAARVPAVPTFVDGAFEAMPRTSRFPRLRPVSVSFGPPQTFAEGQPQAIADALHDAVAALEEKDLRSAI